MKELKTGIQLYTLREALKQDFKGVIRELAKLKCDGVEFACQYGDMEPQELAEFMNSTGVTACGMVSGADALINPDDPAYDYARALKVENINCSYFCDFAAEWQPLAAKLELAGQVATEAGFRFSYHNHHAEFAKSSGECALDLIYANTNPEFVQAELDVYWVAYGGEDPVSYIKKYNDRIHVLHFKDMDKNDRSWTELGKGSIDLAACVYEARHSSCRWIVYEQDACKQDPMQSTIESLEYLNKLLGK